MALVLSYLMFGCGVATFILAFGSIYSRDERGWDDILFSGFCFGSSVWSFGFGILLIQTEPLYAYYCRCAGMIGTFAYLIFATLLLVEWNGKKDGIVRVITYFPFSAVILYPFLMQKGNTTYFLSKFGMSYVFKSGLWNTLYSAYCVIVALNLSILVMMICRNKQRKWVRVMGHRLMVCEAVIVAGMSLDTILPLFGVGAFPGSSIAQSLGTVLIALVYHFNKKNQIKLRNMSTFVYYSVESPVLIYGADKKLEIANKSAIDFLSLSENYKDTSLFQLFEIEDELKDTGEATLKVDARCCVNHALCRLAINKIVDAYHEVSGYIVIIDDLTDKMEIIRELKEAREKADVANRAKTTFLTQMSHEIRTPLNSIMGMNEMILRKESEKEIQTYAKSIKMAGETLLGIINGILDLSKLEAGKITIVEEDYNLKKVLKEMINLVSLKMKEKGLALLYHFDKDVPMELHGDQLRIKQIITNIMNNAIKYTDEGSISLSISCEKAEKEQIILIIQISDTGQGIREEDMERLFLPFERLDEKKNHGIEGNGLGLTVTQKLIKKMEGTLEVESIYQEGSTFRIKLPQKISQVITSSATETEYEKAESLCLIAPKARILLVDDMPSNLLVLTALLERTKIQVETVNSGKACLEKMRDNLYNIVFMDHMMPEMDGIETLHEIRSQNLDCNQKIPFIAMTANAIAGAREEYLKAGFTDYLSKPIDYRILECMIKKYLPEELVETEA